MIATLRCAPPDNKPTVVERDTCSPWLLAEWRSVLPTVRVVVALGGFGWDAALRTVRELGGAAPALKPRFAHGARVELQVPTEQPSSAQPLTSIFRVIVVVSARDARKCLSAGETWAGQRSRSHKLRGTP
jgi:hypothetical protein